MVSNSSILIFLKSFEVIFFFDFAILVVYLYLVYLIWYCFFVIKNINNKMTDQNKTSDQSVSTVNSNYQDIDEFLSWEISETK